MTNLMERAMVDVNEKTGRNVRSSLWMALSGIGIVMLLGAIAGYLSEHDAQGGGPLGATGIAVLGVFAAIIVALIFAIWKLILQLQRSGERVPRREKLNNRILLGCGLLGGTIGLVLAATDNLGAEEAGLFASGPIAPVLAVVLSIAIGVVMPVVTFYWHRNVIDEQEEAAYRAGALFAIYAFWFIAPVWWLLWCGGMLPAPNGVALYLMTTFVALVVWFWKKYR